MASRQVPSTSKEAFKEFTDELRQKDYLIIISALEKLGSATYEQIAKECKRDKTAVGRRMSELERLQKTWRPGGKFPTSKGRPAFLWQLTSQPEPLQPPTEKAIKGKGISDFFTAIKNIATDSKQRGFIQGQLF